MIFDLQLFAVGVTGIQMNSAHTMVEINNRGGQGAGTAWTANNSAYIGIQFGAQNMPTGLSIGVKSAFSTWASNVSSFAGKTWNLMNVSGATGVQWGADDIAQITSVSLMGEFQTAKGDNFDLKINNGFVSNISLGKYSMNLILSDVGVNSLNGNNEVTVDDLAMTANGRNITFDGEELALMSRSSTSMVGTALITNGLYTAEVNAKTVLGDSSIVGSKGDKLEFRTVGNSTLRFGANSDSVFVNMEDEGLFGYLQVESDGVERLTVNNLEGRLDIIGVKNNSNILINGQSSTQASVLVYDSDGKQAGADLNSTVSIIGSENGDTDDGGIKAYLSGTGIEYIDISKHGAGVVSSYGVDSLGNVGNNSAEALKNGWVFTNRSIVGSKGANVVSIGDHSILDIEGAITGNKNNGAAGTYGAGGTITTDLSAIKTGEGRSNSEGKISNQYMYLGTHVGNSGDGDKDGESGVRSTLAITYAANNGEKDGGLFGSYEGVAVESKGKTYNALMMSADALDSVDTGLNWSAYDIVVGDILNLGNRTDKKVVFLDNGLDKNDWGETISYSANMTSVISSTVGQSLIIGDFENKINFRGEGHLDSLYGGKDYGKGNFDTLSSAAGKKAWMGTSQESGKTVVQLTHNGSDTYNFGFVGESYTTTDSTGASVTKTETTETADVLALMNMGGKLYSTLVGSEHGRANFSIGYDKDNHFKFESITEGVHDTMYTYDLGKENFVARVDTSLEGSTSGFNFSDDIDWFYGFDKGTVLSMNAEDTGKMVNYGGKNVITGISVIDGFDAAGGNILNGQVDHAERILASDKVGDTLCGGISAKDTDIASDTLVGGAGADVFQVGANLGDDTLLNVGDGDTIIFLDSKFADVKLNYENERMTDYSDSHWMTATFSDDAGGAKISITPGNGLTDHMSDVKNLTAIFRSDGVDDVYTWDGKAWTQATEA